MGMYFGSQSSSSSSSMFTPSQTRQTLSRSMSPPSLAAAGQSSSFSPSSSSSSGFGKNDIDELQEHYEGFKKYSKVVRMDTKLRAKINKYLAQIKETLNMAYKAEGNGNYGTVTNLSIKVNAIMEKFENRLIRDGFNERR